MSENGIATVEFYQRLRDKAEATGSEKLQGALKGSNVLQPEKGPAPPKVG